MAEPPAKRRRLGSSASLSRSRTTPANYTPEDLVTLLIGPSERKLVAYGHQLSKHSDFFKAALEKEWAESQTRTVKLPEEEFDNVSRYLDYISGQGLPREHVKSYSELEAPECQYMQLTDLYLFGERILDFPVRNAIIKDFIRLLSFRSGEGQFAAPSTPAMHKIFEETPVRSPLRRLMVDMQVNWCNAVDNDEPSEFISEVARAYCDKAARKLEYDEWRAVDLRAEDYLV